MSAQRANCGAIVRERRGVGGLECPRASRRRRRRRSRTCRRPRCARRRRPRGPGPGAWRGSRSTARPGHRRRSRSSRLLLLSRPDRAIIWARCPPRLPPPHPPRVAVRADPLVALQRLAQPPIAFAGRPCSSWRRTRLVRLRHERDEVVPDELERAVELSGRLVRPGAREGAAEHDPALRLVPAQGRARRCRPRCAVARPPRGRRARAAPRPRRRAPSPRTGAPCASRS